MTGTRVKRGDVVMDGSGSYAVFTEQGVSVSNDGRESSGRDRQTTWMRRTSKRSSIRLHPSQNGGRSKMAETSKSVCPDIWIRLPRHKWQNHGPTSKNQWFPFERNLYGHPLAGFAVERDRSKKYSGKWMGKSMNLGMPVRAPPASSISVRARGRHQNRREKARSGTYVEKIDEAYVIF